MNRNIFIVILLFLAGALIVALIINYNVNQERKTKKYEQLQGEIRDLENKRDEAYARTGKDDQKTENVQIISEELLRQKREKLRPYEKKAQE